jgi:hypothetical protein
VSVFQQSFSVKCLKWSQLLEGAILPLNLTLPPGIHGNLLSNAL